MNQKNKNGIYVGISLAVAIGDGICKALAKKHLSNGEEKELFHGKVRLRLLFNPGAALGFLKNKRELLLAENSLLLGIAIAGFWQILREKGHVLAKLALALLVGGGASNLLDRLTQGKVTDYFSLHVPERFKGLRKIVFNLSDVGVFLGSVLYLISKSIPWPVRKRAANVSQDASKL
jgi:signal peptidase II